MIRHIVLTKFKSDTSDETISSIFDGLAGVVAKLPGAEHFTGGRSVSPENIERGYMHGFVIDFRDRDALQAYTDDADHKALGAELVRNAIGGIDGILVLDIDV